MRPYRLETLEYLDVLGVKRVDTIGLGNLLITLVALHNNNYICQEEN